VTLGPARNGMDSVNDPRLLAAGAAGLASAVLALWAFRGLPAGPAFFWLSPMPLFMAGIGFGQGALLGSVGLGMVLMLLLGSGLTAGIWLVAFGLPALALTMAGLRNGRIEPSMPLAMLGIYPAAVLLMVAFVASDAEGGLDGVLRGLAAGGMTRLGMPMDDGFAAQIARFMAGALAFWLAVALAVNGTGAQSLLTRFGMASMATPAWREARLPRWFAVLPVLAGLWFVLAPAGGDALPLGLVTAFLTPFFFQGLGVIHGLGRDFPARPFLLGGFYAVLVVFIFPVAIFVVGIGLFSQFGWRPSPPPQI